MTARILVVDDIPANVHLLEVRLLAEYFEVLTASNGPDAIDICQNGKIDVVLIDVMMPGMNGFEVCRRLKADAATAHIPVVIITALGETADRVDGLEAGADDFLTKPVNDLQLMTRVKSLVRLKMLTDELRLRAATTRNIGIEKLLSRRLLEEDLLPKILLIGEPVSSGESIRGFLSGKVELDVVTDPEVALFQAAEEPYECVLISTAFVDYDPLRLCSQLRAVDRTRFLPIILLTDVGDEDRVISGLELGINDYLVRPLDEHELTARLRTQIKRKRYNDHLRTSVTETMSLAVTDWLTGLPERRFFDVHLERLFNRAMSQKRPLSFMFMDLDCLKSVNDQYGHDAGGKVLQEFAKRLLKNVRPIDACCHYGGDEFVVVFPDTELSITERVARSFRREVERTPFEITRNGVSITVTVSIGLSALRHGQDTVSDLKKRADQALFDAKRGGRNRVKVTQN